MLRLGGEGIDRFVEWDGIGWVGLGEMGVLDTECALVLYSKALMIDDQRSFDSTSCTLMRVSR